MKDACLPSGRIYDFRMKFLIYEFIKKENGAKVCLWDSGNQIFRKVFGLMRLDRYSKMMK
ncbi:MAG: hypothetical protein NTX61_15150 [Bacteroidetes bacterium]|nr:hypothetical protein [Bacteroidota bacterium]